MNLEKIPLQFKPPIPMGARFVVSLSQGCVERVDVDTSQLVWEAVSYDGDLRALGEFSDRFLLPWSRAWAQGEDDELPLKEEKKEADLRRGLKGIMNGMTISYADFGKRISVCPRVAGRLLANNRFPLVIPCHRVIRTDGALGGYLGGVDLKEQLLQMERSLYFNL